MYIKRTDVNTRDNTRTKFKLMSKNTGKYLDSPLYRGGSLLDKLENNVQDRPTIYKTLYTCSDKGMSDIYRPTAMVAKILSANNNYMTLIIEMYSTYSSML